MEVTKWVILAGKSEGEVGIQELIGGLGRKLKKTSQHAGITPLHGR